MRGNFPHTQYDALLLLNFSRCNCTESLPGRSTHSRIKVQHRSGWRQRTSHSPLRCTFPKTVRLLAKSVSNVARDQNPFLSHNNFTKKKEIILCSLTFSYWLSHWTTRSFTANLPWLEGKGSKAQPQESHASVRGRHSCSLSATEVTGRTQQRADHVRND